jgi:hypothetical protein
MSSELRGTLHIKCPVLMGHTVSAIHVKRIRKRGHQQRDPIYVLKSLVSWRSREQHESTFFLYFVAVLVIIMSWDSTVSIVSDYVLDGRGSIPDRGTGFFL